jgi:hypothetical protein
MLKKAAFSPAQPRRVLHPPAQRLPRQPLCPRTGRSAGKAAASEGPRRYPPHLCSRSPVQWILANGKPPQAFPIFESLNRYVEGLSAARTPRAAPLPIGPRPPIGAPIRSPIYQYFNRANSDHAELSQHQQISLRTNALSTSSTPTAAPAAVQPINIFVLLVLPSPNLQVPYPPGYHQHQPSVTFSLFMGTC